MTDESTSDRRVVVEVDARLHEVIDRSVAALAADPEIFQRDGQLVRCIRVAEADVNRERMSAGTPQIRRVSTATLRERLTRHIRYRRLDRTGELRDVVPSEHVVAGILNRGEWPTVRPLTGIIETPSMRPDGSILDQPGYDAQTGFLLAPGTTFPPVPPLPSLSDARLALKALLTPWRDFPFSSEAGRYVPVAALLTLVARPAICGACPGFLFDATTPGSGKSLLARSVSTLAHGREAAVATWPRQEEELQKVLAAYALRGAAIVCFDNVDSLFGGAPLDKVLTCTDRVELRVLRATEVPALVWRAVTFAGGNNLVVGRDTTRRVLVARLVPRLDRPEERSDFEITDLARWCREHHPHMVVAALTLLRGYVLAGRPRQDLSGWGSFEPWRDLIAAALIWAGGENVMQTRPTSTGDEDPDTAALRTLVRELPSLVGKDGGTAATIIKLLWPDDVQATGPRLDGRENLRHALLALAPPDASGRPPDPRKLGMALAKRRGRFVGGLALERTTASANMGCWYVQSAGLEVPEVPEVPGSLGSGTTGTTGTRRA